MATPKKDTITTLSDLTPDPSNANKGTERGHALLDTSIERYGLGRSIVTDRNGVILAGNKTYEAAGQKGLDAVEVVHTTGERLVVVVRDDLEHGTAQATGLALADNRVGQVGLDFDFDVIQGIADDGFEDEVLSFWFENEIAQEQSERSWSVGELDHKKSESFVRPVIAISDVQTVERAFRATGIKNRGDAFVFLCSAFLKENTVFELNET